MSVKTMALANGFVFNQSNLQDFIECQRRFQLRYLLHQAWPAVEVEPYLEYEHLIDQGSLFHKIVHQHLIGVPEASIEQYLGSDETMNLWWINYQHAIRKGSLSMIFEPGSKRYVELSLSIPLLEYRLVAKYDLLALLPDDKLLIIDWKTSKIRSKRNSIINRIQTHVYPFVLSQASSPITDGRLPNPDCIEMIYWFTHHPDQPEIFTSRDINYISDAKLLENLVLSISQINEPVFPLTQEIKHCRFCTYRSLCNRGLTPGELIELDAWRESEVTAEDISLEYDQISEIEF